MTTASTTTSTSAAQTIQQLQSTYGPQAQAIGHSAATAYFNNLLLLQIISLLLTAFFIAFTINIIIKTGWLRTRMERIQEVVFKSDLSKKHVHETWASVERHFFAGDDNDLKMALIEADTMLDEALRSAGVSGTQLGDRLKKVSAAELPNVEDVWQAHKLRNRIAHETDFVLKRDLAERALTVYEIALEHLGVLEQTDEKEAKATGS